LKSIYIAWASYQRRAVSMQKYLGLSLHHVPPAQGNKLMKMIGYLEQSFATVQVVRKQKPEIVWIQLPPNFIVHLLLAWRFISASRFKIVLDCHNAALRKPWLSVPFFAAACRASDLVVVHNAEVLRALPIELANDRPALILEDPPSSFDNVHSTSSHESFVLVPCSFHDDEPIEMILAAARLVPDITFKITGRIAKAKAKGFMQDVPHNVVFTDYVTEEEFNELLHTSAVVAGLTTYEGIQLSVASEAIGAGKALILSGTRILRNMFQDCALFFENDEKAFADAVRRSILDRSAMEFRSKESLIRRIEDWNKKATDINIALAETNSKQ